MGEPNQYLFDFKEIAEVLVKRQNLHDGIWGLIFEFGLQATNAGPSDSQILPAAIIPIMRMGLQKVTQETNLSVDAAKVNPPDKSQISGKQKKKRNTP